MIWLLTFLLFFLISPASAQDQSGVPHSGIGVCPSGQVVNRLNSNAAPGCIPNGAGGSSFPLTSDVSGAGHKIQNLGAGASSGDALSYLQANAVLNGLALNSMQLTGLAPATGANQALAYGQTGALLNGLNLNSNQVSNLSNASANGQAVSFGQSGSQLIDVRLIPAATFPGSPTIGDQATVNTATNCISGSTITLGGSALCLGIWNGTNWIAGGGSSGAAAGPINTLPTQTGTYHAGTQGQDQLGNLTADTGSAHTIQYFDTNGQLNVRAHGAVANGSTCDDPSIQATINAACAASTSTFIPAVYFPSGNYKTCKPIIITCGTSNALTLQSDDHGVAALSPNFTGPVLIPAAANLISSLNSGTITSAALVSGGPAGSASLFWTTTTPWYLDIQQDIGSVTPTMLNGASALTVRGFFSTPSNSVGETITSSSGAADYWKGTCNTFNSNILGGQSVCTGAWGVWLDGTDHKLHGYVTTSNNGVVYVTSSGTVTINTTLEYDLEYDGAHAQLALAGTWGPAVVATGTIVRRSDETATIGTMIGYWPHLNPFASFNGSIFDPEIANVARQTLGTNYTQHSTVYTFDTHTLYGSTFDQQINMPSSSSPAVFGADYFNGAATTSTWARAQNFGLGCCGGHYDIKYIGVSGGSVQIDVADADVTVDHFADASWTYMSIDLVPNATFNSSLMDIRGFGASQNMGQVIAEGGIQTVTRLYTLACGQLCDYINNGSIRDAYVAGQSNTQWGVVCVQGCSLSNLNDDNENGGTCSGVTMEVSPTQNSAAFVIDDNSQLSGCAANVDPITIEGSANFFTAAFSFTGDQFFLPNPLPPAIVHVVGGTSNVPPSLTFSGNYYNTAQAPTIPYQDGSASLQVVSASHWISQASTDWPLPLIVTNNEKFFCKSCDPPTNPPTPCTKTGSSTPGSEVRGINGQWYCGLY